MHPDEEKYANEIEKSIYNVGLANQVGSRGIIYHARLVGMKGDLPVPLCTNSCCEGQGTRLLGSLPEYIYSVAPTASTSTSSSRRPSSGSSPARRSKLK